MCPGLLVRFAFFYPCPRTDDLAVSMYLSALGGPHAFLFWLVFVGGLLISDIFRVLQTYWLGHWSKQYDLRPFDEVNVT